MDGTGVSLLGVVLTIAISGPQDTVLVLRRRHFPHRDKCPAGEGLPSGEC